MGMPLEKEELTGKPWPLGQCQFPINKNDFVPLEKIVRDCNLTETYVKQR